VAALSDTRDDKGLLPDIGMGSFAGPQAKIAVLDLAQHER